MRALALAALLVACSGGGDGGPDASLDAIEPWADAYGVYVVTLTETTRTAACGDAAIVPSLAFHISAEAAGFSPSAQVLAVEASPARIYATVRLEVADVWGALSPTVAYELTVQPDGATGGTATATDGACVIDLAVTGTNQCPGASASCGVFDDGWNVWCAAGTVYSDDLTRYGYCHEGGLEPECFLGGAGDEGVATTCATGCADTEVHWFETFEEYSAFDPATLCNP